MLRKRGGGRAGRRFPKTAEGARAMVLGATQEMGNEQRKHEALQHEVADLRVRLMFREGELGEKMRLMRALRTSPFSQWYGKQRHTEAQAQLLEGLQRHLSGLVANSRSVTDLPHRVRQLMETFNFPPALLLAEPAAAAAGESGR